MLSPSFNCPLAEKPKQTLFIVSNSILNPIHGKGFLLYWCVLRVQAAPNCFCHSTSLCFGRAQLFSRLQFTLSSLCNQGTPAPHPQIQIKSESRLRPASPSHGDITRLTCLPRKIRSPWHMFSKQHGWSFGWKRSTLGAARHGDCLFSYSESQN